MSAFTESDIENYYNQMVEVYREIWDPQIHTGYFLAPDDSLEQACHRMNTHLANLAGITKDAHILSVGCGQGGADRFLTQQLGATVVGIDLSEKQLDQARTTAAEQGLSITYIHASMTELPVADESFAYVWIQQSLFLCPHKDKAVSEIARVLQPNGIAVVEDMVLEKPEAKTEVLAGFGQRVKINDLHTVDQYLELFERYGFNALRVDNLTDHFSKTFAIVSASIKSKLDKIDHLVPVEHRARLDIEHGFARSAQLAADGKLGCSAFVFRKSAL